VKFSWESRDAGCQGPGLRKVVKVLRYFRMTWIAREVERAAVGPRAGCLGAHTTSLSLYSWLLACARQTHSTHYRRLKSQWKVIVASSSCSIEDFRQ
jgi:hypothetical protein